MFRDYDLAHRSVHHPLLVLLGPSVPDVFGPSSVFVFARLRPQSEVAICFWPNGSDVLGFGFGLLLGVLVLGVGAWDRSVFSVVVLVSCARTVLLHLASFVCTR